MPLPSRPLWRAVTVTTFVETDEVNRQVERALIAPLIAAAIGVLGVARGHGDVDLLAADHERDRAGGSRRARHVIVF
jgi:hypothetical protein